MHAGRWALVDCASIILSIIQQNEHYFKLLFQFSTASIIRTFILCVENKKIHHSSRIIVFILFLYCFWKILRSVLRQAAEATLSISERLSNYLAAAQDVIMPCEEDKVKWWRQQSENLPHLSSAVMKVLLVQPSSAAAERVFSILNSSFNDSQEHALVDYLQACVTLQYNNR